MSWVSKPNFIKKLKAPLSSSHNVTAAYHQTIISSKSKKCCLFTHLCRDHSDGIVSCSCASVRSRVIVSGHPPLIGDKTNPRFGDKEEECVPPNSPSSPHIVRLGKSTHPYTTSYELPWPRNGLLKPSTPLPEKWSPEISARIPVPLRPNLVSLNPNPHPTS